ncbi:dual specificity phosphatase [Ophiocordyceps camponoti-floridani]|uniref:phosphatidylinositol-3,4,5-trisphosphate 3-phosphatase n=1 Tax=Ophiocordyceps camponoti-floridani TaxID=2030778 RepID=A0A8H4Q2V2_9HYPO|nr:dual specificity phosphatase [Ophiocordyceps camponoti-floridani]
MASILRQIVAGPRARHPEAGLDLCYVTDSIVATSGPSQTYPQRAYRNPLDQLVAFLDSKHGQDWAIWEFRAEGTGYPDEAVYGRIRHYPWPDHHPPPFRLVPLIMASMRNWLHGGSLEGSPCSSSEEAAGEAARRRVAVVHCKAGKGRSGTVTCSYLISEAGWTAESALARFTERRMRPKFGAGVSIPSQLRWIGYVDRWTRHGKKYVECAVEIVELHVWGLRNGVKVDVQGYVEDGRVIRVFHTFPRHERLVVTAGAPVGDGVGQAIWDLAGYPATSAADAAPEAADLADATNKPLKEEEEDKEGKKKKKKKQTKNDEGTRHERPSLPDRSGTEPPGQHVTRHKLMRKGTDLIQRVSPTAADGPNQSQQQQQQQQQSWRPDAPSDSTTTRVEPPEEPEPGGMAVIFRPEEPIRLPTGDVNVSVERRNKSSKSIGLTMVTAVAHVWFNAFFEGQGPERDGLPSDSGVFTIDWEAMDGIKGSSRKGGRALDRLAVVWRLASDAPRPEEIPEPAEGQPVPQLRPAEGTVLSEPDLGLRVQSPASEDVSRASSSSGRGGGFVGWGGGEAEGDE